MKQRSWITFTCPPWLGELIDRQASAICANRSRYCEETIAAALGKQHKNAAKWARVLKRMREQEQHE